MHKIIRRRPLLVGPLSLAQDSPLLNRIFAARGVTSVQEVTYRLQHLLSPQLKGLSAAMSLLTSALQNSERILIVGDFDADGATSTALAVRCLKAFGYQDVHFLVPNRFEYGYGLTPEIVEVAAELKPQLLITVDNGISSLAGVERAQSLGIKVLITDHHLPGAQLPKAEAIVNPNQPGCDFASKAAAGVGVVFYVMMALRGHLRDLKWFNHLRPEPNLAHFLDIVALGTVADVVPLDSNNRIFIAQGLQRIKAGHACAGIKALIQVAGRRAAKLSASDLGFAVAPRLNAAGRLDDMTLGIQCLLTDDDQYALQLAQELDDLNRERQAIEASMQKEASLNVDQLLTRYSGDLPAGVCLYQEDWHQGVIGILASRIKEQWHRPVIVFASDGQGALKGSGRSIKGLHLRDVLDQIATQNPSILQKFGGHAMAAGLSLKVEHLPIFEQIFAQTVQEYLGDDGLNPVIETDGELNLDEFNLSLATQLAVAGPWGQAFPEPSFDGIFKVHEYKWLNQKHLKILLSPRGAPQFCLDAIAFNQNPNAQAVSEHIHIAYKLSINDFRGRQQLQLIIDYWEPVAQTDEEFL